MSDWTFVLCDLGGGAIGELSRASARQVAIPLMGGRTATFTVRNDHPLGDLLLDGDAMVKAYHGSTLRFLGDIVTAEEVVSEDGMSIAVNCADPWWRLGKRLIGKSVDGVSYGTALAMQDRGAIVSSALGTVNAEADTGVRAVVTASSLTYVGPWYYKPLSEAITELAAPLDGFEYVTEPVEPTADGTGVQFANLVVAPLIGTDQPNAIFEYGFGKHNLVSVQRAVDRDGLANAAYALPPDFPIDTGAASDSDAASIIERGRFEAVVDNDLQSADLRSRLVTEHVGIRKQPRQTITIVPHQQAGYVYGTDYEVGDTIRVRAKSPVQGSEDPQVRLDVAVRVYGVVFDISDEDVTAVSIETVAS